MKKLVTNERLIIVILLILFGFGINYHFNQKAKDENKYETQLKLTEALGDSLRYFKTKKGEWGVEKRTLQGNIKYLLNENSNLSFQQRDLLETVKRLNKEWRKDKEIFAAARIEYESLIDSLNSFIAGATNIDSINNSISFVETDSAVHFIYDLDILGVKPASFEINPQIKFNRIDFPNIQTVTFNFDKNERKDYPVSFSVINTNPYYKAYNIESYAIKGIDKDVVNPKGWKRAWKWVKINGKYVLVGAAGFAVGAAVYGN